MGRARRRIVPARIAGGQAWVVDLSAPQFNQPAQGITIPPLRMPVSSGFLAGEPQAYQLPGVHLMIKRNPALTKSVLAEIADADEFLDRLATFTEHHIKSRRLAVAHANLNQTGTTQASSGDAVSGARQGAA
jgi:hypothetical protein